MRLAATRTLQARIKNGFRRKPESIFFFDAHRSGHRATLGWVIDFRTNHALSPLHNAHRSLLFAACALTRRFMQSAQ
jgi:hypothetical protein